MSEIETLLPGLYTNIHNTQHPIQKQPSKPLTDHVLYNHLACQGVYFYSNSLIFVKFYEFFIKKELVCLVNV